MKNWKQLQELAGVLGTRRALRAKVEAKSGPGEESLLLLSLHLTVTDCLAASLQVPKIKYNDGAAWVEGVIESVKPVRLALADSSTIEVSPDVFREAVAVGIVALR